jgi:hypothetical protein
MFGVGGIGKRMAALGRICPVKITLGVNAYTVALQTGNHD